VTSTRRTRRSTSRGSGSRPARSCGAGRGREDRALAGGGPLRRSRRARPSKGRTGSKGRGFYAFATLRPRDTVEADRGPERARRQARLEALARAASRTRTP
jgi:hypothetical protein